MGKKFETFANDVDKAKPVSDFDFDAYRERIKNVVRDARRNHARAILSAKEVFIGR